jgi:hypothetical protein
MTARTQQITIPQGAEPSHRSTIHPMNAPAPMVPENSKATAP